MQKDSIYYAVRKDLVLAFILMHLEKVYNYRATKLSVIYNNYAKAISYDCA